MWSRPYSLRSRWVLPVGRGELWDALLSQLESGDPLPWWGSVRAVGTTPDTIDLRADTALGYRLGFTVSDLELARPDHLTFSADGDLRGRAVVRFVPAPGSTTILLIEWDVVATRAWMRSVDPLARPLFVISHALLMRRGERRLAAWLQGGDVRTSRRRER